MTDARLVTIVPDALDLAPEARDAFLDTHCRDAAGNPDAALLAEARALIRASEEALASGAFRSPLAGLMGDVAQEESLNAHAPPETVGPWRVTGVLGEGGQGIVYRAVRADGAFEREVALKLLRPGVASGPLAERLAEERRVLGRLEHPGIARLYDGGLDADGRPYLAMERVPGQPITAWASGATQEARLRVFAAACDAVAYAHARFIVHRDLKPGNLFVVQGERGPEPKLLDFGIAKLIAPEASGDAEGAADSADPLVTAGALTPAYAAPEQLAGDEVTTATDVYALGVILHETLTGRRPAPAASGDAGSLAPEATSSKGTAPEARLDRDLAAIVARATAARPADRYDSASALGADVRRYLGGLPVEAREATAGYRLGRFVRRHRAGVGGAAAALVAVMVVAGAAFARVTAERDRAETEAAKSGAVSEFLTTMLRASDPTAEGQGVRVADLLDLASQDADSLLADQPEVEAAVRQSLARTYMELARHTETEREMLRAISLLDRAVGRTHPDAVAARVTLGEGYLVAARYAESDSVLTEALADERARGDEPTETLGHLLGNLAVVKYYQSDLEGFVDANEQAIAILEQLPDADPVEIAAARGNQAVVLSDLGRYDESIAVRRQQIEVYRRELSDDNFRVARPLQSLAVTLHDAGRTPEALSTMEEALAMIRGRSEEVGSEPVEYVRWLAAYAEMLTTAERLADAEHAQEEAEAVAERSFTPPHPALVRVLESRAKLLEAQGLWRDAADAARRSAEMARETMGEDSRDLADALLIQGRALARAGSREQAQAPLARARAIYAEVYGPRHHATAQADSLLRAARR